MNLFIRQYARYYTTQYSYSIYYYTYIKKSILRQAGSRKVTAASASITIIRRSKHQEKSCKAEILKKFSMFRVFSLVTFLFGCSAEQTLFLYRNRLCCLLVVPRQDFVLQWLIRKLRTRKEENKIGGKKFFIQLELKYPFGILCVNRWNCSTYN